MLKKIFFIIFITTALNNFSYSQNLDLTKQYESCADDMLVAHLGSKIDDYLSLSIKTKIDSNQVYEWFYEDCEKQAKTKPISFNLKNSLYKEDLNEVTSEVFERCADERYVLEFGDTYNQFLDLSLKEKMKQQIEYEWFIEACEDEYKTYPIKFKIKYY